MRGTDSPSGSSPRSGWALVFFNHVASSAKKGAKLLSKDKV